MSQVAVVLVGGPSTGTRFRPLSLAVPKPLFPVANRALLWHHVCACKKLPSLAKVILLGFYKRQEMEAFIEEAGEELGVDIDYLEEPHQLGNAGGLWHYASQIRESLQREKNDHDDHDDEKTVFVLHGDVLCSFPLDDMLKFHVGHGRQATILGKRLARSAFEEYPGRFGCLVEDEQTHVVRHFVEKPETFVSDVVSCGVYAFSLHVFDRLDAIAERLRRQAQCDMAGVDRRVFLSRSSSGDSSSVRIRLELDLLADLCASQALCLFQIGDNEWWMPVKTPSDVLCCSTFLLGQGFSSSSSSNSNAAVAASSLSSASSSQAEESFHRVGNVLVHESATVDASAKLGPNVTVGPNATIGPGVRIVDSIVLAGSTIDDNACILHSIVGWNSTIGQWARLDQSEQRITILGNDVKVPPEILVRGCIVLPHKEIKNSVANTILL
jgi:mannose-1-phosphate guanylyltransferase